MNRRCGGWDTASTSGGYSTIGCGSDGETAEDVQQPHHHSGFVPNIE